ncbi:MAG TPA: TlpA disulfide reductase family protein [Candidatus Deferrimicrobiaceae bacterium]|jgi:peroxiredoxin
MKTRPSVALLAFALFLLAIVPTSSSALCVKVGEELPNVTLPTLEGESVSLHSFRGKIVMLAFWASWCPRCMDELTYLQGISKTSPDIVVVGINQESQNISRAHKERIKRSLKEGKIDFTVLVDENLDAWRTFCINALPTSIILDKKGVVRFAEPNYYWATQDKIAEIIQAIRLGK